MKRFLLFAALIFAGCASERGDAGALSDCVDVTPEIVAPATPRHHHDYHLYVWEDVYYGLVDPEYDPNESE